MNKASGRAAASTSADSDHPMNTESQEKGLGKYMHWLYEMHGFSLKI